MNLIIAIGAFIINSFAPDTNCAVERFKNADFTVCHYDIRQNDIGIFHKDKKGNAYGSLGKFLSSQETEGKKVVFAMNGGMYHRDLSPVGLLTINGETIREIIKGKGNERGNFFLKPNGYFAVLKDRAVVRVTEDFEKDEGDIIFATQSGPMLVIDGKLHPRFLPKSDSLKLRNGVGVSDDGQTIHFAISHGRVNFHTFGSLFKDALKTPNALFLDGTISALYHPTHKRLNWFPVGPIIGIVEKPKSSFWDNVSEQLLEN